MNEAVRFREVVDSLMPTLAGRWVIFLDGAVISDHETEDEAYEESLERFGYDGGQLIAFVGPPQVVWSSLALLGY